MSANDEIQLERNLKGIELEKQGKTDDAIVLYEKNIEERFQGNHPYDRLVILYKKMNRPNDAVRVLNVAIDVFENDVFEGRTDRVPKLEKFKEKLKKF